MRELRPPGSVRGVPSNGHPYRDSGAPIKAPPMCRKATFTLLLGSLRDENGDRWPETVGEEGDGPNRD